MLDAATWQRLTEVLKAVAKVWSSTAGSDCLGMQVVPVVWIGGRRKEPTSMRLWRKGGKSKVELAVEMLREAARWEVKPE